MIIERQNIDFNIRHRRHCTKLSYSLSRTVVNLSEIDNLLFKRLKVWRAKVAKEKNYPAYVVFKDKSLKQIATMKPKDKTELIQVEGIGKQKLEDYGKSILDIVNE